MAFGRVQFCCNCFGKLSEGCRISGATDSPCKGMDTFVTHGTKVHLLNKAACMTETKSYIGRTGENVSLGVVLFMPLWLYCSIHLQSRYAIFLSVSGQGSTLSNVSSAPARVILPNSSGFLVTSIGFVLVFTLEHGKQAILLVIIGCLENFQ